MNIKALKYTILFPMIMFWIFLVVIGVSEKTIENTDTTILLSDSEILVNGMKIGSEGDIYISNDIIYYESKDFYNNGNPYGEGVEKDKHTREEAEGVTVLNIKKPGKYILKGNLSQGQIRVDLGENAYKDKSAVVTIVLDGVNINCDIAPAILFLNVYECDYRRTKENAIMDISTDEAGANIIIAENSVNNIYGSYVAKIYKEKGGQKKLWKQDGALTSYMSINIDGVGEGVLNIKAEKEGICTERHITINGGNINICSEDDGINASDDFISVATVNNGNIHIAAGLGESGDGIDSNGWIIMNNGTVISVGHPKVDSGIDNEKGFFANGGTFVSLGNRVDWADLNSKNPTLNLQLQNEISSNNAITFTDSAGNVVFCYNPPEDEVISEKLRDCCGIIISSPDFFIGEKYNMYIGGKTYGKENLGLYNTSEPVKLEDGTQQMFFADIDFGYGGYNIEEDKNANDRKPQEDFCFKKVVNCFAGITYSTE